jgi:hypothetical protein
MREAPKLQLEAATPAEGFSRRGCIAAAGALTAERDQAARLQGARPEGLYAPNGRGDRAGGRDPRRRRHPREAEAPAIQGRARRVEAAGRRRRARSGEGPGRGRHPHPGDAYTLDDRPAGTVRTLLAIEIDAGARARQAANEHARSVFTLSVAVAHRDSGRTQRLDQRLELEAGRAKSGDGWLTLSREFDVRPGVAQARVVVRDETGGQLGALSLRFVVPVVSAFRLSTPVLTDRVTTTDPAAPGRPVLTAHREFSPEGRIYCQFQVFGPAKASWPAGAVEASYVLRRREGPIADQSEPSPIRSSPDGRLVRLLVLSVEGMAPGDYELVLRVFDKVNKETREQAESFRILPGHHLDREPFGILAGVEPGHAPSHQVHLGFRLREGDPDRSAPHRRCRGLRTVARSRPRCRDTPWAA